MKDDLNNEKENGRITVRKQKTKNLYFHEGIQWVFLLFKGRISYF